MSRFIKIGEASKLLGVTPQTLRRWERDGHLVPDKKTEGNTRYYNLDRLLNIRKVEADLTVGYARVSGHDQKGTCNGKQNYYPRSVPLGMDLRASA